MKIWKSREQNKKQKFEWKKIYLYEDKCNTADFWYVSMFLSVVFVVLVVFAGVTVLGRIVVGFSLVFESSINILSALYGLISPKQLCLQEIV